MAENAVEKMRREPAEWWPDFFGRWFDAPFPTLREEKLKVEEFIEGKELVVRAEGLAGLSLRDLANRVGMRAPSLYSYFDSKHAIYDAMFAQGYEQFRARQYQPRDGEDPLDALKKGTRAFVEFCVEDPARYQLLFQRTIPGFEPSAESYAIAVEVLESTRRNLAANGIRKKAHLDLLTALNTGLADQQISNDPGGDRWLRRVDDAMEMYFAFVRRS